MFFFLPQLRLLFCIFGVPVWYLSSPLVWSCPLFLFILPWITIEFGDQKYISDCSKLPLIHFPGNRKEISKSSLRKDITLFKKLNRNIISSVFTRFLFVPKRLLLLKKVCQLKHPFFPLFLIFFDLLSFLTCYLTRAIPQMTATGPNHKSFTTKIIPVRPWPDVQGLKCIDLDHTHNHGLINYTYGFLILDLIWKEMCNKVS